MPAPHPPFQAEAGAFLPRAAASPTASFTSTQATPAAHPRIGTTWDRPHSTIAAPCPIRAALEISRRIHNSRTWPAATPQELVQGLIAEVNRLIAAGTLPHRHGNALLLILRAALNSINRGHAQAACGLTGAFIKIVQAFTSHGQLNGADGQALISAANNLRAALGCGRSMNPEEATEVGAGVANGDFQPLMNLMNAK